MYLSSGACPERPPNRRQFLRLEIQCRARIHIGTRHYAGYLANISQAGAKLRTITPIRKLGPVLLRLPDLPPLRCELRWTEEYDAGVSFAPGLTRAQLIEWLDSRLVLVSENVPSSALSMSVGR
jgi:PilZ domain